MRTLIFAALCASQAALAVEPAVMTTLEDGNHVFVLATPATNLPLPAQDPFVLGAGAAPHGLAFLSGLEILVAHFSQPIVQRGRIDAGGANASVSLAPRTSANGTLAVAPNGRFALSVGESLQGAAESVAIDFATTPPTVAPIVPALRVRAFVTAAIDFAPDGRAFICHADGVSVLKPPYIAVEFTMAFPALVQSPSMCRLTRDGSRLFVTRVLSETVPTVNGVRTTAAPYSAQSTFVTMPAPAGVQGLGPMAVSPDGGALIVGQQFLFPPETGTRARAFVLRAPFGAGTGYDEITLPTSLTGVNCTAEGNPRDCPGFEHIEVSDDGSLAILTGNSSSAQANVADRVPAVFVRNPFDALSRDAIAVQIAPQASVPGRGVGAVRFQPQRIFRDSLESL